jgi:hypothetical protein
MIKWVGLPNRFALLELERDDGIRTFLAREIATGQPVQVHLLPHTDPGNAGLLGRLARSPDFIQRQILDRGYHEGIPYVVTLPLAHQMTFREWMTALDRISASSASLEKQFAGLFEGRSEEPLPGRRGQWKVVVPKTVVPITVVPITRDQTGTAGTITLGAAPVGPTEVLRTDAGSGRRDRAVAEYPRLPLMTREQPGGGSSTRIAGLASLDDPVPSGLRLLDATAGFPPAMRAIEAQPVPPPQTASSWRSSPSLKSVARRVLAVVFGVAAALVLLGIAAAFFAFRPR